MLIDILLPVGFLLLFWGVGGGGYGGCCFIGKLYLFCLFHWQVISNSTQRLQKLIYLYLSTDCLSYQTVQKFMCVCFNFLYLQGFSGSSNMEMYVKNTWFEVWEERKLCVKIKFLYDMPLVKNVQVLLKNTKFWDEQKPFCYMLDMVCEVLYFMPSLGDTISMLTRNNAKPVCGHVTLIHFIHTHFCQQACTRYYRCIFW